jgi:hypothetical protein
MRKQQTDPDQYRRRLYQANIINFALWGCEAGTLKE